MAKNMKKTYLFSTLILGLPTSKNSTPCTLIKCTYVLDYTCYINSKPEIINGHLWKIVEWIKMYLQKCTMFLVAFCKFYLQLDFIILSRFFFTSTFFLEKQTECTIHQYFKQWNMSWKSSAFCLHHRLSIET